MEIRREENVDTLLYKVSPILKFLRFRLNDHFAVLQMT